MDVSVEFIAAACNLTYNCLELSSDQLIYGSNQAVVLYDLRDKKVLKTYVKHKGRVNCLRFIKQSEERYVLSGGADGQLILWENHHHLFQNEGLPVAVREKGLVPIISHQNETRDRIIVCDGILLPGKDDSHSQKYLFGYLTSVSTVVIGYADTTEKSAALCQEINLNQAVALDICFDSFGRIGLMMALGMDTGEVALYGSTSAETEFISDFSFEKVSALKKHEDWVRCLALTTLENGERLLAAAGQDSYISIWRLKSNQEVMSSEFEFQVVQFKNIKIVFDSMILGHEGWINSLQWNDNGELISCSSDQTIIIWENLGEIWAEKVRLGVVGGQLPGGFCSRFNSSFLVSSGFHGAIQIWSFSKESELWEIEPSVTGHFKTVTDLDFHPDGHYLVTTSEDQTTRVFAPWGQDRSRWHEISRPQIHGHDIFTLKCSSDYIVSGAEEKILRVFQPTEVFVISYEVVSGSSMALSNVAEAATLPALGLSNQSETPDTFGQCIRLEERFDEYFLRSHTLWPEVTKLYGHGYEICAIGASPKGNLIASGCNSSKPAFSSIILWCTRTWKNLGEFHFHKLNVTGLEFSADGNRLLSVSRDRTWALWKVVALEEDGTNRSSLKFIEHSGFHTRALSVGTWYPAGKFFVTGSRDKRLVVWKSSKPSEMAGYKTAHVENCQHPVSAASVNEHGIIAVGFESGTISIFSFNFYSEHAELECILKLDHSEAHHGMVRKLTFNPRLQYELASGSSDHAVKIYNLRGLKGT